MCVCVCAAQILLPLALQLCDNLAALPALRYVQKLQPYVAVAVAVFASQCVCVSVLTAAAAAHAEHQLLRRKKQKQTETATTTTAANTPAARLFVVVQREFAGKNCVRCKRNNRAKIRAVEDRLQKN